ncbi:MAG: ATP-binding cassette domain-containing protein [Bacteroidia bacterium]|nr:ATP-binding cassette domain-containing protein [Bacteroidia bacterium]
MSDLFIDIKQVLPRIPGKIFSKPFNFQIKQGQCWAFYGKNGSGKTLLSEIICGRYGLKSGVIEYPFIDEIRKTVSDYIYPRQYIKTVGFQSTYSMSDFRDAYYQQRFNSQEVDWYPTVAELLSAFDDKEWLNELVDLMNLKDLMNNHLITLSSGQLRRLLITKALLEKPRMLIFDNPFIGLDVETRELMNLVFEKLMKNGVQILFLIPVLRDIPACITHVLHLDNCSPIFQGKYSDFKEVLPSESAVIDKKFDFSKLSLPMHSDYQNVVKMEGLDINYGPIVYQKDINWTIKKGEKWALSGPNGSGKSTLLSYIFADNPQAYGKPLHLFDKRRGSGESIWDIKKRIGFTSSEMHLYYLENVPCISVVESGFFDSIGLFRKCSPLQAALAESLMDYLCLSELKNVSFLNVSSGEQRLLLFARALVKNPELLILDEPFHGLDYCKKQLCLSMINDYAMQEEKSLIFVTHYKEEIPACVTNIKRLS